MESFGRIGALLMDESWLGRWMKMAYTKPVSSTVSDHDLSISRPRTWSCFSGQVSSGPNALSFMGVITPNNRKQVNEHRRCNG